MYKGEKEISEFLSKAKKPASLEEIAKAVGMGIDGVRRAVEALRAGGYASVLTQEKEALSLTQEAKGYLATRQLPELAVYKKALKKAAVADLTPEEKTFGVRWAKVKGFVDIENGKLVPKKEQNDVNAAMSAALSLLDSISHSKPVLDAVLLDELFRRNLVAKTTQKTMFAQVTDKNFEAEDIFDISAEAKNAELGKNHPVTKLTNKLKLVFAELGFEEMEGEFIETAFWNFDALFQPQDHPARELADTFYVKGEGKLPDAQLVKRVKEAHEKSWKYEWKESEAKRQVLRTHTTALSARYLASLKGKEPKRYFAVGRVFRNEATDYSHLAEFHQVEGIIAWENATFRDLLGMLKEFYKKLGFEKVRFRPSYFPYTEPSLEVEIFYEPRKKWLEIGGAGILRPEVSLPLCNRYPVLAWGLSLERPLMLLTNEEDIRTFYRNDLNFLRNAVLKV